MLNQVKFVSVKVRHLIKQQMYKSQSLALSVAATAQ